MLHNEQYETMSQFLNWCFGEEKKVAAHSSVAIATWQNHLAVELVTLGCCGRNPDRGFSATRPINIFRNVPV